MSAVESIKNKIRIWERNREVAQKKQMQNNAELQKVQAKYEQDSKKLQIENKNLTTEITNATNQIADLQHELQREQKSLDEAMKKAQEKAANDNSPQKKASGFF